MKDEASNKNTNRANVFHRHALGTHRRLLKGR